MIDYKLKYLKYKTKYLNKKNTKISIDELMTKITELYQLIEFNFDEVYLTGSAAIISLAYFIEKKLIPKDYPLPNDVDFIGYQDSKVNNIKVNKIGEYSRNTNNQVSSDTFSSTTTDNYFTKFDLITTNKPLSHHVINFNGHNLKIYNIDSLKKDYQKDLLISDTRTYDKKKIRLIERIQKYFKDNEMKLATEFNPKITEISFTHDLALDSVSSDEDIEIPSVTRKLF